ncbi:MAG: type II toxin-antitoxin system Phd/YefM family antitoxin [Alphaproteobacteria bacterium]|nr:type II toxin-antitoxin system Phd/YefM family antitoxin [Alphaproteobacteria bacterium]
MTVTRLSARELDQDLGRARRATRHGPVILTDSGKPSLVLLSYSDYERMTRTIGELLHLPGAADVELPLPVRSERAALRDL